MEARIFIPSHAPATDDISALAAYNAQKVMETAERILDICSEPLPADGVIQRVFISYGLRMTIEQYVLIGSTVRSYLAWLKDRGEIGIEVSDSMIRWRRL